MGNIGIKVMIDKVFVIESILKTKMLVWSMPAILKYMNTLSKSKTTTYKRGLVLQATEIVKSIQKKKDFNYYDSFVLVMLLSSEFEKVKLDIQNGDFDLDVDFKREDYWREEDVGLIEAVFFVCTFLNETYKEQLSRDVKYLDIVTSRDISRGNVAKAGETYLKKISKIKKENCID
jgi:hypothetical protein